METCKWQECSDDWMTECGIWYPLSSGSPSAAQFFFCPKCGKKIIPLADRRIKYSPEELNNFAKKERKEFERTTLEKAEDVLHIVLQGLTEEYEIQFKEDAADAAWRIIRRDAYFPADEVEEKEE